MAKRGDGEGTVWQDGQLWRGRVTRKGFAPRRVSAPTKKECTALLAEAARELREGVRRPVGRLTVAKYLEDWLDAKRGQLRARSLVSYEQYIRVHIVPAVGDLRLTELQPAQVTSLLRKMVAAGSSPATAIKARAVLRSALTDAVRDGDLVRNVASLARAPRAQPPAVRWLDAAEARRFLEAAVEDRAGDVLVITLLLGLRRGEVLGMRWEDVDSTARTLRVERATYRKGGVPVVDEVKSRAGRRRLPLTHAALLIFARQRERQIADQAVNPSWEDTGYVWTNPAGQPWSNTWLSNALQRVLKAADLPRITLHKLRHSTASILLEDGTAARVVADLLGHSSVTLTLATYSHVAPRMIDAATDALGALTGASETQLSRQLSPAPTKGGRWERLLSRRSKGSDRATRRIRTDDLRITKA